MAKIVGNGFYQNMVVKSPFTGDKCPRCGESLAPNGYFMRTSVLIPLKFKFFVFKVTLLVKVCISYCPKCGFLRVDLQKAD